MNKKQKITAIVLCLFFVAVLALSLDFIAEETHHDCCGEECPICAVLHTADNILEGVKRIVGTVVAFALFISVTILLKRVCFSFLKTKTPIVLFDTLTM